MFTISSGRGQRSDLWSSKDKVQENEGKEDYLEKLDVGFLPSEDLEGGSGHGGRPQVAKGVGEAERKGGRGV